MYFNDYIGNISSTSATRGDEHVTCEYSPRFPICGGWKTDWNQGYQVPTKYHLTRDLQNDNLYRLEIPFLHSYDVLLAENQTVEIILPFGASNI
jgi:oligosaccharyltransferase complex subunit alpha (ribophorin I)